MSISITWIETFDNVISNLIFIVNSHQNLIRSLFWNLNIGVVSKKLNNSIPQFNNIAYFFCEKYSFGKKVQIWLRIVHFDDFPVFVKYIIFFQWFSFGCWSFKQLHSIKLREQNRAIVIGIIALFVSNILLKAVCCLIVLAL